jgi:hypothetical protein
MLYKSKAKIFVLILSVIFAFGAVALIVFHIINRVQENEFLANIYLGASTASAAMFFFCFGAAQIIQSRYERRSEKRFVRGLGIGIISVGVIALIVAIITFIQLG